MIRRCLLCDIDFAVGHSYAAGFPKEIERPLQLDAGLVVRAGWFLLLRERERRIRSQARLLAEPARDVHLRARGAQGWLTLERTSDGLVQGQASDRIDVRRRGLFCAVRLRVSDKTQRENADCNGYDTRPH